MAQRSSLLWLGLLAGIGAVWAFRKKPAESPKPSSQPTGWQVNDLCTNAELVDPEAAIRDAQAWHEARQIPPLPIGPSASAKANMVAGLRDAMDRYFRDTFDCEFAPDSILWTGGTTVPEDIADQTANVFAAITGAGGGSENLLTQWAAALVGR